MAAASQTVHAWQKILMPWARPSATNQNIPCTLRRAEYPGLMPTVSQELSNEVSFWVLAALSEAPKHGYAILRDVEMLSASQGSPVSLKIPTLYGALERLNRMELIEVVGEEVVDGRARRYYRLTEQGVTALEDETRRLEARVRVARSVMPVESSVQLDRSGR